MTSSSSQTSSLGARALAALALGTLLGFSLSRIGFTDDRIDGRITGRRTTASVGSSAAFVPLLLLDNINPEPCAGEAERAQQAHHEVEV